MSKIRDALLAACGLALIAGEDHQALGARLAVAVSSLSDDAYDKLSDDQQDWANKAAAAINEGAAVPAFPDAEAPPPARQRQRTAAAPAQAAAYVPKLNDVVTVTTLRGSVSTGPLVEITADLYVLDVDGKDVEIAKDRVKSIVSGEPGAGAADPELPAAPSVGDTVEVVTMRDAVIVGNVLEMGDGVLVLKDATGAEHELSVSRLKSVKVKVVNSGRAASPAPAPATTRQRAASPAPAPAPAPAARTRATNAGGVSATFRLRELVAEFPTLKEEEIVAKARAEGLEFKDNTAGMIYGDCHKFMGILTKLGRLK